MKALALTTALLSSIAAPAVAQVEAYHDVDGAEHQDHADTLAGLGYRMTALTIYGTPAKPQYGAVWVQRPGPEMAAFHGLNGVDYQDWVEEVCALGYTPKLLSATGPAGNPRFAGFFEKTDQPCFIQHGLTFDGLWDAVAEARDLGYRMITADVYGDSSDRRFIVGFVPNSEGIGWNAIVSGSANSFQDHFDAYVDTHARLALAAVNEEERFLSLWTDDSVGSWLSHADMTSEEYEVLAEEYWEQGYYPIHLDAGGAGDGRRFAAVWAQTDLPLQRQWTATGQFVPELAAFDTWVQDWMQQNNGRAASMAVVKDGRLVFARGYTWAESGYPITQPTSLFRTASTSKPLTSIAMHQHFERMAAVAPGDLVNQYLGFPNVLEPMTNSVTLRHLLTHQGGWAQGSGDYTAMDGTVAAALGVSYPLTKFHTRAYVTQSVLMDFVPGTTGSYCNYGFSLIGQVLESLNPGMTYDRILHRDVFAPLGIQRPSIAGSLVEDIRPGEVRYHPSTPSLVASVMSADQPLVPSQYGGLNIGKRDAHGGWVMAAADYAKVLAAFDFEKANPLMSPSWAASMWTVAAGNQNGASGWFTYSDFDDGAGGNVQVTAHNGGQPGTSTLIARRADGISFVLFTNSDAGLRTRVDSESLSDLANTVSVWPNHDLFPSVGLPGCREHVPGQFEYFGNGCRGSRGLVQIEGDGTPELGQVFGMHLNQGAANSPAFAMIGPIFHDLDLSPIGATGCSLHTDARWIRPVVTNGQGAGTVLIQVPDDTAFFGQMFFGQFAVVDPTANAFGWTTSNALGIWVGGWQ